MVAEDFLIPKAGMVVALHWHMNRNPELWGEDSNDFRPERFLTDDGKDTDRIKNNEKKQKLIVPPYFMPFQVIRN